MRGDSMNITIDYSSDLPMYEQVKGCVKENILSGTLKVNDPLPSVRQLAKELNVSTITTKRAYMDLEHEGLIYTVSGKGTFVKAVDISKLLTERNKELLEEYERKTIEMKDAGITKESIINIIEKIYRG
jgi:GntR family transcriptional regulator